MGSGSYGKSAPYPESKKPLDQWLEDQEGRGRKVGSELRKRNELGLAGICLVPGPLGVLLWGLDCDTELSTGPGRRL